MPTRARRGVACANSETGAHHWVLATSSARNVPAVCKFCSGDRVFAGDEVAGSHFASTASNGEHTGRDAAARLAASRKRGGNVMVQRAKQATAQQQ